MTYLTILSLLLYVPMGDLIDPNPGSGVPDPWHFGVDPDPDPLIHASD
jgi:hypothetical protein